MLNLHSILKLVSPQDAALVKLGSETLGAIGAQLPESDQTWLTAHLAGFPEFLKSEDGGSIVRLLIETYREKVTSNKPI